MRQKAAFFTDVSLKPSSYEGMLGAEGNVDSAGNSSCVAGSQKYRQQAATPSSSMARKITRFLALTGMIVPIPVANASPFLIEQIGDDSSVRVSNSGIDSRISVEQIGDTLTAELVFSGANNSAQISQAGNASSISLNVLGQNNDIMFVQIGDIALEANNEIIASVEGNDNLMTISQTNHYGGNYGNTAMVVQQGDYNEAIINQTINPQLSAGINYTDVSQLGMNNFAQVTQTGADNYARVEQQGSGNSGTIIQEGSGLNAELVQIGNGQERTITQTGCAVAECGTVSITTTGF